MGLDVYLYKMNKPVHEVLELEKVAEDAADQIWVNAMGGKSYEDATQDERDEARAKCKEYYAASGLDEWGRDNQGREPIELDSEKYPEHMFKIGYLRSSYNSGGLNSFLRDRTGQDLYDVFLPMGRSEFVPDWKKCKTRCKKILTKFRKYLNENGNFTVLDMSTLLRDAKDYPKGKAEVLGLFNAERKRNESKPQGIMGGWYSTCNGMFCVSDPPILRMLTMGMDSCGGVAAYAVIESAPGAPGARGPVDWYLEALEVTLEMIEWVLKQDKPEDYTLHWSA